MKRTSDGSGPARAAISRRHLLASASAAVATTVLGFPAIRTRAAATLKVGTYGGYFKDSFDQHIYPAFHRGDRDRDRVDRRADRRGMAGPAADRRARQHRPGRCQHDGPGHAHQRPERRALGAAGRGEAAQHQEPRAALRPALSGWPDQRDRRGLVVHHAGDQHRGVSRAAHLLESALGPGERGSPRAACAGQQLVPARDHGQDLDGRLRHPG